MDRAQVSQLRNVFSIICIAIDVHTLTLLWSIVVLVLHSLSLLTISLVTSTSASTKLLCSNGPGWMSASSTLIMDRFLAHLLAFMAAILSKGIASGNDEDLNNITWFSQYFLNIIFTFSVWIVLKSGLTVIKSLCMSLSMYVYKNSQSEHLYEINQLFWLDHFLEYNYENYTPKYYHCQERSAFKFMGTNVCS